mgnify:CR=1 FL=1
MNQVIHEAVAQSWRWRLFTAVKYVTYALLSFNIFLFLEQELVSATYSTTTALDFGGFIQLFSTTLDTAAWVLLLLLFELETAVIPDTHLVGWTKRTIHGARLLAGAAICFAFVGYWEEWLVLQSYEPLVVEACTKLGSDWSILVDFDEFVALTADNCSHLGSQVLVLTELDQVLVSQSALVGADYLALVDTINAGAWILVVVFLEVEVRMQLRGGVPRFILPVMNAAKFGLYATLLAAAIYWWLEGDFLDFWDAALWLFAFVFIEMNVFEWQQEIEAQEAVA